MNIYKVLIAIASLMFFMIGFDKFFGFLQPPCSLESNIPTQIWIMLGAMQLAAGVIMWLPKYRRPVAIFFTIFMTVFTIVHLVHGTYDIGGSVFMAVLLGLIAWEPKFLKGK